jgi:hypothetical protein
MEIKNKLFSLKLKTNDLYYPSVKLIKRKTNMDMDKSLLESKLTSRSYSLGDGAKYLRRLSDFICNDLGLTIGNSHDMGILIDILKEALEIVRNR